MTTSYDKIFPVTKRSAFMDFTIKSLSFLAMVFMVSGCDKPETTMESSQLNLSFSGRYGTVPFQTLQPFPIGTVKSIKISKLDFYLTGFTLLSPTGNIELTDAALVDITGNSDQDRTVILKGLKRGDYSGIRFQVGVKPDLNKKLPKDFKSNHPLSSTSHYWEAWNSYIFSKIEGVLDPKGDKVYDLGFAVHTGTDVCLESVQIDKSFTLTDHQTFSLNLDLDVEKIFLQGGQYFDLESSPLNHNPSNIPTLKLFATSLAGAIQLKN